MLVLDEVLVFSELHCSYMSTELDHVFTGVIIECWDYRYPHIAVLKVFKSVKTIVVTS